MIGAWSLEPRSVTSLLGTERSTSPDVLGAVVGEVREVVAELDAEAVDVVVGGDDRAHRHARDHRDVVDRQHVGRVGHGEQELALVVLADRDRVVAAHEAGVDEAGQVGVDLEDGEVDALDAEALGEHARQLLGRQDAVLDQHAAGQAARLARVLRRRARRPPPWRSRARRRPGRSGASSGRATAAASMPGTSEIGGTSACRCEIAGEEVLGGGTDTPRTSAVLIPGSSAWTDVRVASSARGPRKRPCAHRSAETRRTTQALDSSGWIGSSRGPLRFGPSPRDPRPGPKPYHRPSPRALTRGFLTP